MKNLQTFDEFINESLKLYDTEPNLDKIMTNEGRRAEIGKGIANLQIAKRNLAKKKSGLTKKHSQEKDPKKKSLKSLQLKEITIKLSLIAVKEQQLKIRQSLAKT
jgi:hypothetical protein